MYLDDSGAAVVGSRAKIVNRHAEAALHPSAVGVKNKRFATTPHFRVSLSVSTRFGMVTDEGIAVVIVIFIDFLSVTLNRHSMQLPPCGPVFYLLHPPHCPTRLPAAIKGIGFGCVTTEGLTKHTFGGDSSSWNLCLPRTTHAPSRCQGNHTGAGS